MLELIGTDIARTLSRPDYDAIEYAKKIIDAGNSSPAVAELGIGVGATTLEWCKLLNNSGIVYIFDFQERVDELKSDLMKIGFHNVVAYGNSQRYWDSYHWSLSKLIQSEEPESTFDLVYIDGAHTYFHDALAFFMCDRLLKVGGYILFDDYDWSYSQSNYLSGIRDQLMTPEQISSKQIKLLVDQLVKTSPNYEEIVPTKVYQKSRRHR
jgi:predicted O-methyltransferase YrrM